MDRFRCTRRDFLKGSSAGLLGLSLPVSFSIAGENENDTMILSSGVFLDLCNRTVIRSSETGKFRIWYGVPENASQTHLATMESDDGINWKRPHKVLEDPAFIQFGASIIDDGSDYPDSEKRYKYEWYSSEGGLRIAASPDGLKWKPLTSRVVLEFNHDIVGIYRHSIRNRYMALHSLYSEGADWEGRAA